MCDHCERLDTTGISPFESLFLDPNYVIAIASSLPLGHAIAHVVVLMTKIDAGENNGSCIPGLKPVQINIYWVGSQPKRNCDSTCT